MLILPHVFIFAVAHELPPLIRLIYFIYYCGGNKRVSVCLASLVLYILKRSGLFLSFRALRPPRLCPE